MPEKNLPLDRTLAVLEAVIVAARPLSMTEIAQMCGLPLPTVHRLVAQAEERGLLKRLLGSKRLGVGFRLLNLGFGAVQASLRADLPHQVLTALAERLGEHCHLGIRADNSVVYMDTVKATRSQGLHFEPGRRSPLYCTSIGKLFLAEMPHDEFEWWLNHFELEPLTPNTLVRTDHLLKAVKLVRKQGWATSNEELAVGVVGCAVPVRDKSGKLIAGLGISVPNARVSYNNLSEFRPAMEQAAQEIMDFGSDQA